MQKFSTQIVHTIQQVNGEVRLSIPQLDISSPEHASENHEVGELVSILICFRFLQKSNLLLKNGQALFPDFLKEKLQKHPKERDH
jgi:hypothetical protein